MDGPSDIDAVVAYAALGTAGVGRVLDWRAYSAGRTVSGTGAVAVEVVVGSVGLENNHCMDHYYQCYDMYYFEDYN